VSLNALVAMFIIPAFIQTIALAGLRIQYNKFHLVYARRLISLQFTLELVFVISS